jgi:hypothetical protein
MYYKDFVKRRTVELLPLFNNAGLILLKKSTI